MKRITFIIALVFATISVVAQNSADARKLLDKTYNAYIGSDGISLKFNTTYIDSNGNEYDPQKGEAFIKGDKFRLEMDAMNIWFDGKTQWVLMKDIDEVNISNPTDSELASVSPLALLGIYKDGVTLNNPESKTINGEDVYVVEMTPTKKNIDFKAISVAVHKTKNILVEALLTMPDGSKNRIDITDYNSNYKFEDKEFSFDKSLYPDVEVIDLR